MAQDFLGSIAQEDVQFLTQIFRTATPGDNYWKLMVFIEESRFVEDPDAFVTIPGTTLKVATVTGDNYSSVVKGLLKSWLFDFYASGAPSECYLVIAGADIVGGINTDFVTGMSDAYNKLKAYAYWKTVCAGGDDEIDPALAVAIAGKCAEDKALLSGAPLFPYTTATPEDPSTDPIYAALSANGITSATDAILTCYADPYRNGSLFRLGQALAFFNNSGTPVGNNFDFIATSSIASSGPVGSTLSYSIRTLLKGLFISYFKPVGDGTGNNAAVGVRTLAGEFIQANWIVAYINFMSKTSVANYITRPNTLRNAATYAQILRLMSRQIGRFGDMGSGRLVGITITAPAFSNLPPAAGDEIIVPNAWAATYTDQVHKVQVFGQLTIAG